MNLPIQSRPIDRKRMAFAQGQLTQQQFNLGCAACCIPKAGYAACVARCQLDGRACDGGLNNCSSC